MFTKIFEYVIKFRNSTIGKILIMGAVNEYVKRNDNQLTKDVADTIEEML